VYYIASEKAMYYTIIVASEKAMYYTIIVASEKAMYYTIIVASEKAMYYTRASISMFRLSFTAEDIGGHYRFDNAVYPEVFAVIRMIRKVGRFPWNSKYS
jgi:hypothetical protein